MHRRLPSKFGDTTERGVNTGQRICSRDRLPKARRSRFICDGVEHGCGVHVAWARVARLRHTEALPPRHDRLRYRVDRGSTMPAERAETEHLPAHPSQPAVAIPSGVSITACRRPYADRIMSPFSIGRHGSDAGPAHCSRSPSRQSGRATNRARMSCARRLKRVFDLDIEHCPNCRGASSGDTLPTSHGASLVGRYPGQAWI